MTPPKALAGAVRPRSIPGNQSYRPLLPQPACAPGSGATFGPGAPDGAVAASPHSQLRCWVHMGAYDDLGMFCADLDANQKQVPVGYTLHMTKVRGADIPGDDQA
ncbi:hypothetical protein GPECTOR_44g92 [Gonium pectorale]|uniref:Uncharacterized protein n=1 Tax=Gonium pectorale TaxID=33097 RepID=A0A150G999_GONPE|nr:hypothetical protein GPECTOR_44g92 [Gonium pectorale]|eukprot:KXZ46419.1 hypothetical protein GPECTOR_44g92 [Gonium pectorale]